MRECQIRWHIVYNPPPFIKWGKPEETLQTTPILEILRNPS